MTEAPGTVNSIVSGRTLGHHRPMLPIARLLVAASALAACTPLSIYYRPGVDVARMQSDTTRCEVASLRDAPVANQIRQRPPIFIPGRNVCNGGKCYYAPGYWVDGGFYTVDLNRDLRARVMDLCMAEKRYQPISFPNCSPAIASAVPKATTLRLPKISESSCVIKYNDNSWQIVTPQQTTASQ